MGVAGRGGAAAVRDLGLCPAAANPDYRHGAHLVLPRHGPLFDYHISVDSYGVDFGQTKDVDLAPGAEIYAKVVSNDHWIEGGGGGRGGGGGYHRDTFYVWLYPAEQARPVIAQSWFYGGGTLTAAVPSR